MEWLYAVIGVVAGLMFGAWLGRAGSSAKELSDELKLTKEELAAYRGKVTQHFVRTAELVEILASNSRDIYQHLAAGSQELCDSDAIRLNDSAMLKALPESAIEEAPAQQEAEGAESAEVSTGMEEQQAQPEATQAVEEGDGKEQAAATTPQDETQPSEVAAAQQADAQDSDVTTEPQGETKKADDSDSKSEWVELIPQMDERKDQARLH